MIVIGAVSLAFTVLAPAAASAQSATDLCRIDVHATPVVSPFQHLFVVYTDPTGVRFTYQARAENIPPVEGSWGRITTNYPGEEGGTEDPVSRIPPKTKTIASGAAACSSGTTPGPHRCFQQQLARIDAAVIPYDPLPDGDSREGNSNSTVYTLLSHCGTPEGYVPDKPVADLLAPGWGIDLCNFAPTCRPGISVSRVVTSAGGVSAGGGAGLNVTIMNTGTAPLHVGAITGQDVVGFERASVCSGATIQPGSTCTFDASYLGSPAPSVTIPSDAPTSPTVVALRGASGDGGQSSGTNPGQEPGGTNPPAGTCPDGVIVDGQCVPFGTISGPGPQ